MQLENGLNSLKYNKSQTNGNIQAVHIWWNFVSLTIAYSIDGAILQQGQWVYLHFGPIHGWGSYSVHVTSALW
jgi:hypothetical protein